MIWNYNCVYVYMWAYRCNKSLREIIDIQYKLKINGNVYMIPPIPPDSCIDNGMFCCTHVVFKDAHSSYPLSFAINFLMQALISNASNFQRQKLENQAHTYMYTQAHSYVSPVNIRWYFKKVPFVLAFNFISPHDYWHVTRMHILKMIWINRCFRQHQMMWSFRTIKLHYWNCQLIWKMKMMP